MAPIRLGLSFDERKIAVGPSAPPMMAMPAAWFGSKPSASAIMYAPKMMPCGKKRGRRNMQNDVTHPAM